jgi:hypothetical protein
VSESLKASHRRRDQRIKQRLATYLRPRRTPVMSCIVGGSRSATSSANDRPKSNFTAVPGEPGNLSRVKANAQNEGNTSQGRRASARGWGTWFRRPSHQALGRLDRCQADGRPSVSWCWPPTGVAKFLTLHQNVWQDARRGVVGLRYRRFAGRCRR